MSRDDWADSDKRAALFDTILDPEGVVAAKLGVSIEGRALTVMAMIKKKPCLVPDADRDYSIESTGTLWWASTGYYWSVDTLGGRLFRRTSHLNRRNSHCS
jgi:hypothetical protein